MIKSKRKMNKLLVINNIRLCKSLDTNGSAVYYVHATGKYTGFACTDHLNLRAYPEPAQFDRFLKSLKEPGTFITDTKRDVVRVSG